MSGPAFRRRDRTVLDVAPDSVVKQAARDFAAALADTDAYRAFEETERNLRSDAAAQSAIHAYRRRRASLASGLRSGAIGEGEQQELGRLQQSMVEQPSVRAFLEAQERLKELCQVLGDRLSGEIGFDYASACGGGCCG